MAGQLMVRSIDLSDEMGAPGTVSLIRSRDGFFESLLRMVPQSAIDFFASRGIVDPEEFDLIQDRYRNGAFTSRVLLANRAREAALQIVTDGLASGAPLAQMAKQIREAANPTGLEPIPDHAARLIARNAVGVAYGNGRYQAQMDPKVQRLRPYGRVVTSEDSRVRKSHRVLHGTVFRLDGPLHARYACPMGHNCRCSTTTISQRQFDRRNYILTTSPVPLGGPDPGWEGAPIPLGSLVP